MNISKRSWHYRLVSNFSTWPASNLCPYMRQVVGYSLLSLLIGIFAAGAFAFVTYPIWQFFTSFWFDMLPGLSALCNLVILIGTWCIYRDGWPYHGSPNSVLHQDLLPGLHTPKIRSPFPSVWVEWFRAVHDKVCPLITFVDEE